MPHSGPADLHSALGVCITPSKGCICVCASSLAGVGLDEGHDLPLDLHQLVHVVEHNLHTNMATGTLNMGWLVYSSGV